MNIRHIDLNLLLAFDAIFEEKSITRAANRLNLTQPALSNALNRLRDTLNDPLFVRSSHGMNPTHRAVQLAGPIRSILDQIQGILRENWVFEYATADHTFNLVMSDYCEISMMPALMAWLRHVAQGIKISVKPLVQETLARDMETGRVDLAIGFIPYLEDHFEYCELIRDRFVSVARNDCPFKTDDISLEDYLSVGHITVNPRGEKGTAIEQAIERSGLKREIALYVNNFSSIAPVVSRTNLLGDLPMLIARQDRNFDSLKLIRPPFEVDPVIVNMFWNEKSINESANQWLRRTILEICRDTIGTSHTISK
jgi:DNA-binding transcriptional LysR family regulator